MKTLQDLSHTGIYSSYTVGPNADEFSKESLDDVAKYRPTIDSIVRVLGTCSPATLEFVSTLHFVNARQKGISGSRPAEESVMREFRSIKGNKFSDEDIARWYSWLKDLTSCRY